MKKIILGIFALGVQFSVGAMNEQFESHTVTITPEVQSVADQAARAYVSQTLLNQQSQDAVHVELMKKLKNVMQDPEVLKQWDKVVDGLRGLIETCISRIGLNKSEATQVWQLLALEQEMLSAQGVEQITQEKLAELQFKLIAIALPLQAAAATVGMPAQEDLALSLLVLLINMAQRALQKFSPIDFKAARQAPKLGQPIVPEKLQRSEEYQFE